MRYSKFPRLVMRLAAAATLLTAFCLAAAGQRYFLNWSICDAAGDATCSNTSYRNYNDVRLSISSF